MANGGRRGGLKRTPELWSKLLEAYRAQPGAHEAAGRATGLSLHACQRAWGIGWPDYDYAPPIWQILKEEDQAARARLALVDEKVEEALLDVELRHRLTQELLAEARLQATVEATGRLREGEAERVRAKEAGVLRRAQELGFAASLRGVAKALLAQAVPILNGLTLAAPFVEEDFKQRLRDGKLNPEQVRRWQRHMAEYLQGVAKVMLDAQVIDRKAEGEADLTVEHRTRMTLDEAKRFLGQADEIHARAQLGVIEGGKSDG